MYLHSSWTLRKPQTQGHLHHLEVGEAVHFQYVTIYKYKLNMYIKYIKYKACGFPNKENH